MKCLFYKVFKIEFLFRPRTIDGYFLHQCLGREKTTDAFYPKFKWICSPETAVFKIKSPA